MVARQRRVSAMNDDERFIIWKRKKRVERHQLNMLDF